jgi:hypothetical protein
MNGAALEVSFTLNADGQLGVTAAGLLQAASVTLDGTAWVDPTGTFEVGVAGGAAAGAITVDQHATLIGTGDLLAPVVDNGLITTTGSMFETADLAFGAALNGTDTVQIGADAAASFAAAVGAGIAVDLVAAGGTLTILNPGSFAATIAGFAVGDALAVNAPGITGVAYGATGADTGTLGRPEPQR